MSAMPSEDPVSMTIGDVLSLLRPDFSDVSISKIRFLEGEGLVTPQRAPSGYRRFSMSDVDQLRLVLTAQRDHYLPLKVIKERIEDGTLHSVLNPPSEVSLPTHPEDEHPAQAEPEVEVQVQVRGDSVSGGPGRNAEVDLGASFSARELASQSQLPLETVQQLAASKVLEADPAGKFSGSQLLVCRAYAKLRSHGVEERHMRQVKNSASRDAFMIDQSLQHLPGGERESTSAQMLEALNDAHYWLAMSDLRRKLPTGEQRTRRPRR